MSQCEDESMCWVNPLWVDEVVVACRDGADGVKAIHADADLMNLNGLPWCVQVLGVCLMRSGVLTPAVSMPVRTAYLQRGQWTTRLQHWGQPLVTPLYGCIAGLRIGKTGEYMTGFVVGKTKQNKLVLAGGLKPDRVCVCSVSFKNPHLFYRYPPGYTLVFDELPEFNKRMFY